MVNLSNYCIWCLFFISNFIKSSTVYSASLCTFVRFETMIWPSIRFDLRLRIFRDTLILVFVDENCCLCKCFTDLYLYFFYWLFSSFSCNFNHCAVCFQSFMNTACRSTQNAARVKCFSRLHIVIKVLNKKINIISSVLCWSITLLMFIQTLYYTARTANLGLVKRTGWPCRWFWKFFERFH